MPEPIKSSPFSQGDESYDGSAAKKLPVSDKGSIKIVLLHQVDVFDQFFDGFDVAGRRSVFMLVDAAQ